MGTNIQPGMIFRSTDYNNKTYIILAVELLRTGYSKVWFLISGIEIDSWPISNEYKQLTRFEDSMGWKHVN